MPADQIKSLLKQLHRELDSTASVDPEARSLLHELNYEILDVLEAGSAKPSTVAGIMARLEDVAADLAVEHPQVWGLLRRLVDGLGQMGI